MRSAQLLTLFTVLISTVAAQTVCNATQSCPEDMPCCNQFGECGVGSYCLGGCHPAFSYDISACMAMPICKNSTTVFDDKDKIMSIDDYLGDPEDADWVYSGYLEDYDDANILAMPNQTSGTVVSSTRFIWYGRISSTFRTSRGGGVVSASILFSNAQDEIDWEFVGYNLTSAESNFYYQAVLNYTNVIDIPTSDTFADYHTYDIDWQEDKLEWYIDGKLVRTLNKEDTWNETAETYQYPQTPARVQYSLWPAGDTGAVGTMDWAGGEVDWNSEDMEEYGYFYFILKNATIECYDPPSGTLINGTSAYSFNSSSNYNQEYVMITDDNTILCDSDGSGLDDNDKCSDESSSESSSSSDSDSSSGTSTSKSTKTTSGTTKSKSTSSSSKSTSTSTLMSAQLSQFFQDVEASTATGTNMGLVMSVAPGLSLLAGFLSFILLA